MDDSDLDDDSLQLPAAQMSLYLNSPQEQAHRIKRCSMGDQLDDFKLDTDADPSVIKRLNRESNPECVVTYEHNRLRDSSKL